jgi:hypothetical protein
MNRAELLRMMRLLSALEALGMMRGENRIPDYLIEELAEMVAVLEREILR